MRRIWRKRLKVTKALLAAFFFFVLAKSIDKLGDMEFDRVLPPLAHHLSGPAALLCAFGFSLIFSFVSLWLIAMAVYSYEPVRPSIERALDQKVDHDPIQLNLNDPSDDK